MDKSNLENTKNNISVLIVDDEPELRRSIQSVLQSSLSSIFFEVYEASDGIEAIETVKNHNCDLVLMDVRMPKMDGLSALSEIKEISPRTFVGIMTAHSNLQDAITAIKNGAFDYIEKPVQPEKLISLVNKALETQTMVSSLSLSKPIMDDDIDTDVVGSSQKIHEIYQLIQKLSQVETTVLIRGENGTGKELVAKAIHFNSPHKHGEFVALNCGAIPENLMESELFGHEKGAFTGADQRKIGKFQLANKGTLFLDEIGELKPDLQVKLLRVLQEKTFNPVGSLREVKTNARIIAATNRNLEKMIEEGYFREDLFYRLNVMPIFMPPLRERIEDLETLCRFFLKKFSTEHQREIHNITPQALVKLKAYSWPGNIRELENTIERAFIVEPTHNITENSLPDNIRNYEGDDQSLQWKAQYTGPLDFDTFKEQIEKEFIINALKANQGKINKTVAQANIPKNTLLRKIKKYEIDIKNL